jgi:hypothetical protein
LVDSLGRNQGPMRSLVARLSTWLHSEYLAVKPFNLSAFRPTKSTTLRRCSVLLGCFSSRSSYRKSKNGGRIPRAPNSVDLAAERFRRPFICETFEELTSQVYVLPQFHRRGPDPEIALNHRFQSGVCLRFGDPCLPRDGGHGHIRGIANDYG